MYSANQDGLQFPDLYFFQPKKLFLLQGNDLEIRYLNMCDDEVEPDFFSHKTFSFQSKSDSGNDCGSTTDFQRFLRAESLQNARTHPPRRYLRSQFLHGIFR